MKVIVRVVSIFFTAFLLSCTSFSDFYHPWLDVKTLRNVITLKEGEEPEIIRSDNIDNDMFEVVSNHYYCIGDTSFNGPDEDIIADIKIQCKLNDATIALYSKTYTDTRSGIFTTGNNVTSYDVRRYDYRVLYFVKFTEKVKFGIDVIDLTNQSRQEVGRNTGAYVFIVYKDTPAFYANIVKGDLIIRINEYWVNNVDEYNTILGHFNAEEIEVEFIRKNQTHIAKIRLQ